jgi:hypothetical protein
MLQNSLAAPITALMAAASTDTYSEEDGDGGILEKFR